ncbi:MAG: CDP-alcohol phosphatidyltransferase family protein [Chloroflexi bacterium]|nr:CDP-alcohol phosphatidyltransferase family protein [Chloroflexota bacterium]
MSHGVLPKEVAEGMRVGMAPLARRLHAIGVTPNVVTFTGFALSVAGSVLLAMDRPLAAFILILVGTLSDTLDGTLARAGGGGTKLGAFLDSTVDRLSDSAVAAGTIGLGVAASDALLLWAGVIGLISSSLVPYVRAKAESLGLTANIGLAPREARLTVFLIGLGVWAILGYPLAFTAAVVAVAVLSTITFLQRIAAVAAALRA